MSGDNVIEWPGVTTVDFTPDFVLDKAREWDMEHCLVVGHTKDGELRFGATTCDVAEVLLLLERARINLMNEITERDTEQGS